MSYIDDIIGRPPTIDDMIFAAFMGDVERVKDLLKKNPLLRNAVDIATQETPLHRAADNGHIEVVRILLDHGAYINAQDALGCTPLHLATMKDDAEIVELLLDKGADVNVKDNHDLTASDHALGHIAELFRRHEERRSSRK